MHAPVRAHVLLGQAMREVREHLGVAQAALAGRMGNHQSYVARFENAHELPGDGEGGAWRRWQAAVRDIARSKPRDPEWQAALKEKLTQTTELYAQTRKAYAVERQRLVQAAHGASLGRADTIPGQDDDMRRSAVSPDAVEILPAWRPDEDDGSPDTRVASAGVGLSADDVAEELRERLLNAVAVDAHTLALLAAQAEHIRQIDRYVGALAARTLVRGHVATLGQLRGFGIAPNQREPLARMYADVATLAGWQSLDLGQLDQAWRLYEAAKDAAREGDLSALAHAMAEQAYVLVELDELASAVQLAQYARSVAGTAAPPILRSWLEAVLGELHAAVGDDTACRRAFEQAASLLPDDPHDQELPYVILNGVHLVRWRGNARATLGDTAAIEDLQRALRGMDASFTRARAGLHVDLAAALVAARRYSEANAELGRATTLAARVGSARQRRRIRRLESRLHTT